MGCGLKAEGPAEEECQWETGLKSSNFNQLHPANWKPGGGPLPELWIGAPPGWPLGRSLSSGRGRAWMGFAYRPVSSSWVFAVICYPAKKTNTQPIPALTGKKDAKHKRLVS